VVFLTETLWAEPLPPSTSAQLAEQIALTKALQLPEGKTANIYTDSKYTFLVLHTHVAL
jgi:ribonuclease HI